MQANCKPYKFKKIMVIFSTLLLILCWTPFNNVSIKTSATCASNRNQIVNFHVRDLVFESKSQLSGRTVDCNGRKICSTSLMKRPQKTKNLTRQKFSNYRICLTLSYVKVDILTTVEKKDWDYLKVRNFCDVLTGLVLAFSNFNSIIHSLSRFWRNWGFKMGPRA